MTTHLRLLLITVASGVNQHQHGVMAYLQEENRTHLERLGGEPKCYTNGQRARLARKAKLLGRTRLRGMATLVTPDTLLRWFRRLVAQKWTWAKPNPLGRPAVDSELEKRVVKLVQDNPTWGRNRIVGALANLGYTLSDVTIDTIRRRNGFGGWSQTKEVLYSSCCQPVKPNGDIVFCTTDTYADQYTAYGNVCDKSFLEIPREIVCRDYGHRHISAASWVRVRDPQSGERIWQGKNYRFRSPKNRLRTFLETQNYAWLSTAKRIANSVQNRLKPDSEENQTNLD